MDQVTRNMSGTIAMCGPTVSLFGHFKLKTGESIEAPISNRRARALLAMLCLVPGEAIDREFLSKALWPGRFPAHAKASLRQCLLDTGKLLARFGDDMLIVNRTSVALKRYSILTDLDEIEDALSHLDLPVATALLEKIGTRAVLDQLEFGDLFAEWRDRHGALAEGRLRRAVERALHSLDQSGQIEARKALSDTWSPRASKGGATSVVKAMNGRTRIAILPLKSINPNGTSDYFADGIADELIASLSQVPQLQVAGRTSSFKFRDTNLPTHAVADALNVTHLINGSVQRQGNRVRIFVRLTEGTSGFESWGQRFEGTLDDIFALQEEVAKGVTAELSGQLGLIMAGPSVPAVTGSKKAYDLYLQGRALSAKIFGDAVLETAMETLEEALVLDPLFAEAWLELGEVHHNIAMYTQCSDRQGAALRMADCAREAITLAPELGYSYTLLATYEMTQNNMVGALDLAFEAYRRQPSHPGVTMRLGFILLCCGLTGDAARYVLAAIDQDPVDARKYALLWGLRFGQRDLHGALAAGQRVVDLGWPSMYLAVTSAALGNHEVAVEQYQQTKRLVNRFIMPPVGAPVMTEEAMSAYWLVAAKGICSGAEADRAVYGRLLETMFATLPDPSDNAICGPAVLTGNAELTFKSLGRSLTLANTISLMTLWTDIDPMRRIIQHPQFLDFAERIGLVAVWEKYGWPELVDGPASTH